MGIRAFTLAGAVMFAGSAIAADMPQGYPSSPSSFPAPASSFTSPLNFDNWLDGWYLRGDLGGHKSKAGVTTGSTAATSPRDSKLGDALTAGAGLGYKAGFLRADVTADYLVRANYRASLAGTDDITAKLSGTSLLLNGYIDLGTWYGITPYVGAGAGYSFLRVSDFNSAVLPVVGDSTTTMQNFTYAAMAGVAVKVAPNMQIDIGYRYINYGDLTTPSTTFGPMTINKVAGHEIRAGIRWSFDDLR